MDKAVTSDKLETILTKEELARITIREYPERRASIIADIHGMRCYQAKRFINNIISIVHSAFQLVIIHGYIHGTAIKDILLNDFNNSHIIQQYLDPYNQGVTHMLIA